ncbi:pentapeptide repeat-containing protein [Coleofasciculus sp. H7-2]|uniref:pentapeptide repeat-containing protein n=1 Tax=Coleofasciculus sp. H7-2 TaxID=3351545 RepID=UPI00366BA6EE
MTQTHLKGANLTNANLSDVEWKDVDLSRANLTGATIWSVANGILSPLTKQSYLTVNLWMMTTSDREENTKEY